MQYRKKNGKRSDGSVLVATLVLGALAALTCLGIMQLSLYHFTSQNGRRMHADAFYTAENAMLEGAKRIADNTPDQFLGTYTQGGSKSLNLPYTPSSDVKVVSMTISNDSLGSSNVFEVAATATVGRKKARVWGRVQKDPPSTVFDYEYFLNNWGWWWGSSITAYGDQRSNWDFDFRYSPIVNGHIYANGQVESNMVPVNPFSGTPPFGGTSGANAVYYTHVGVPRVQMPNLKDMSYYQSKATGTIKVGSTTVVNGVQGTSGQTGVYLEGTASNPIVINGTVVILGDAIVKGVITGKGTIYVGGNLYVAGDVTYKSSPDFTTPPATMSDANRDSWVDTNQSKDLVAFAVRQCILGGQVNSSDWQNNCYNADTYGLAHVGGEANLGADGINNTPDDGIPYKDTNGDGKPDSAAYDADGDGVIRGNYNYATDLQLTSSRISNIARYPKDSKNNPQDYNTVATNQITHLQGLYYTNHAVSLFSSSGPEYLDGVLVSRDEAWIFTNSLTFRYDSRVHSRYQYKYYNGDPNRIIDLGLPVAVHASIIDRKEIGMSQK